MAHFIRLVALLAVLAVTAPGHAFKLAASYQTPDGQGVGPLKAGGPRFTILGGADRIAFRPDGNVLYAVDAVQVADPPAPAVIEFVAFDFSTRSEITRFQIGTGLSGNLVVMPSGTKAYAVLPYDTVAVIDLTTYAVTTIPVPTAAGDVAIDAAGDRIVVAGGGTIDSVPFGRLTVIDTATDTIVNSVLLTEQASKVAIAPAGDRLYVDLYSGLSSDIAIFDVATLTELGRVSPAPPAATPFVTALAVHASGSDLYAALRAPYPSFAGEVLIIDTATGTVRGTIAETASALAPAVRGKYLWTSGPAGLGVYKVGCNVRVRRRIPLPGFAGDIAARPCPSCTTFKAPCR